MKESGPQSRRQRDREHSVDIGGMELEANTTKGTPKVDVSAEIEQYIFDHDSFRLLYESAGKKLLPPSSEFSWHYRK